MTGRINGANRAWLTLLGLLLLAAGVLGLLLGSGVFGASRANTPVLPNTLRTFAHGHYWFWWAIGAGALAVALLGLWWLLSQLRTERVTRIDLTDNFSEGATAVHAGALTNALTNEARTIHGVADASTRFRGDSSRRLELQLELADYADIADIRQQMEHTLVPHLRQAMDNPVLPVHIELRPNKSHANHDVQ